MRVCPVCDASNVYAVWLVCDLVLNLVCFVKALRSVWTAVRAMYATIHIYALYARYSLYALHEAYALYRSVTKYKHLFIEF